MINLGGMSHTGKTVKEAMKGKEGNGNSLFMDKFYDSLDLSKRVVRIWNLYDWHLT